MQLKRGSATVSVAAVGVAPTAAGGRGTALNGSAFRRGNVFGQRPKTAGATPALPKTSESFRLRRKGAALRSRKQTFAQSKPQRRDNRRGSRWPAFLCVHRVSAVERLSKESSQNCAMLRDSTAGKTGEALFASPRRPTRAKPTQL